MDEKILAAFVDEIEKIAFTPKLETELMRDIGTRGMAGRLMRQGAGLSGFEKKRVAHMAGLSTGQLEAALERLPKVSFMGSHPIARLLTKILPLSRRRYMRGYLQRSGNPRAPFSGDETDVLKFIAGKKEGLPAAWGAAKAEKPFEEFVEKYAPKTKSADVVSKGSPASPAKPPKALPPPKD